MTENFVEYCPTCNDYVDTVFINNVLTCCKCRTKLGFEEPSISKNWHYETY